MRRDTLREKLFTRRAAILAGGQGLLLAAIGGRMYQLQILDSERYTVLADENRISPRLIAPVRGRILDRFGIALAEKQQNYYLVVVPEHFGFAMSTSRSPIGTRAIQRWIKYLELAHGGRHSECHRLLVAERQPAPMPIS